MVASKVKLRKQITCTLAVLIFEFISELFYPFSDQRLAKAGVIELSGMFSFNNSNLGLSGYQWSRRWELGVGYYLFELSELEFSVQDVLNRTFISGLQDTTFHDQIYSLNWIQYFLDRHSFFSPYFKLGAGQLVREASGSYWTGGAPPALYASLSLVAGVGIKVNFTNNFSVHAQATTYLTDRTIGSLQDNSSLNFGFSAFIY